jgi:hypothetical protein
MKLVSKIFVVSLFLLHTSVFAQPSNDKPMNLGGDNDTEEYDSQKNNHKRGNWSGFEIGVSGLIGLLTENFNLVTYKQIYQVDLIRIG